MLGASAPSDLVVFAGAATYDAVALVSTFPEPDERQVAEDITYGGGGPAATAAVAAKRLGVPSAFVGAVGDDAEGEHILDGLRAEGVDVSAAETLTGRRSGASVIVVDRWGDTRSIMSRPAPGFTVAEGSFAGALLHTASWIHTDHVGWRPVADFGRRMFQQLRLSVDAGNPISGFDPRGVDLYVPTIAALTRTYGQAAPGELLDAALADGARCVVATDGPNSTHASTDAGERHEVPAVSQDRMEILSTLGAGDVFHGALLAALVREMPLRDCLSYANAAAALSCRGLDGRSAIPSHAEVTHHLPASHSAVSDKERQ